MKTWLIIILLLLIPSIATTQTQSNPRDTVGDDTAAAPRSAPVVVDGITLFRVAGISAYPPEERARVIGDRIKLVAANRAYSTQALTTTEAPLGTQILIENHYLMTLLDDDARLEGVQRHVLAQAYLSRIGKAITDFRSDREPRRLIQHGAYATAATLAILLGLFIGYRISRQLRLRLEKRFREKIHDIRIQAFPLVHAEQLRRALIGALSLLWLLLAVAVTYLGAHYVLSLFPWTRGFANSLFAFLVNPLIIIGLALLKAIPNLIFLAILVIVTWYALKLVRLAFFAVESGAITLSGFEAELARPTYRLVRIVLIVFALVAAYPYIPGSNSQAFKGISLLIGVIFSLGSTGLIGNMISGYSMAYRRVFKLGDRVKIGDHIGDVEDIKLMVTYLRTMKNELVAVPNSMIINSDVVNYSSLAETDGLILHTTVGIGYETSWRQVEAMLLQAAENTRGLLREPKPFVLQKQLGDFAITYEINAYCDSPRAMNRLYTALHANILDIFNQYGVQIMTPAYEGDPQQPKVVPKDQWYTAPARPRNQDDTSTAKSIA